jgi:hypothetical protein
MRLRTLTEAECYARCYGGLRDERVSVVRLLPSNPADRTTPGEDLRKQFESYLDAHGPEVEAA